MRGDVLAANWAEVLSYEFGQQALGPLLAILVLPSLYGTSGDEPTTPVHY